MSRRYLCESTCRCRGTGRFSLRSNLEMLRSEHTGDCAADDNRVEQVADPVDQHRCSVGRRVGLQESACEIQTCPMLRAPDINSCRRPGRPVSQRHCPRAGRPAPSMSSMANLQLGRSAHRSSGAALPMNTSCFLLWCSQGWSGAPYRSVSAPSFRPLGALRT